MVKATYASIVIKSHQLPSTRDFPRPQYPFPNPSHNATISPDFQISKLPRFIFLRKMSLSLALNNRYSSFQTIEVYPKQSRTTKDKHAQTSSLHIQFANAIGFNPLGIS